MAPSPKTASTYATSFHTSSRILLAVDKIASASYHPSGNGGVDRVNHTMAKMLAVVVDERDGK